MQTTDTLSFEVIPSRFCDHGDHEPISPDPDNSFSYRHGFSTAYTVPGMFIKREHVNAIGRIGTSAQALLQAGGVVGHVEGVEYGEMAAISEYDGMSVAVWISSADGNLSVPIGSRSSGSYRITDASAVEDGTAPEMTVWTLATPDISSGFFDA